jgi:hypothetical protein
MDYSQILTIALLVISEILPLINRIPANGILHTVKLVLAYLWVKFFHNSDLAREVEQLKSGDIRNVPDPAPSKQFLVFEA